MAEPVARVNEGTTTTLTIAFKDNAGAPGVPSAARYGVWCETTDTEVRPLTAISPLAETAKIVLTPDDMQIVDESNLVETKRVTVIAEFTTPLDRSTVEYDVLVRNLSHV